MDEIALLAGRYPGQHGAGKIGASARRVQRVPTDVGHLLWPPLHIGRRDLHHPPRDQPQPLVQAELLGFVKQHLHAQADAQQRRACGGFLPDRLDQPQLFQPGHAVLERTHAGQYQRIGSQHILGLAGHQGFGAKMGKGVLHAQQVRQAIVDDRHLFHTRRTSTPPARMSSFSSATVSFL